MHEYSIVQAMFDQIEAQAHQRHAVAVKHVYVRIGRSAGVDVPLFKTAYDTFRVRTICEDAPLDASSSLTAVHLACQSLLAGECDLAVAGAAAARAGRPAAPRHAQQDRPAVGRLGRAGLVAGQALAGARAGAAGGAA